MVCLNHCYTNIEVNILFTIRLLLYKNIQIFIFSLLSIIPIIATFYATPMYWYLYNTKAGNIIFNIVFKNEIDPESDLYAHDIKNNFTRLFNITYKFFDSYPHMYATPMLSRFSSVFDPEDIKYILSQPIIQDINTWAEE